jgi:hypothetical protein
LALEHRATQTNHVCTIRKILQCGANQNLV